MNPIVTPAGAASLAAPFAEQTTNEFPPAVARALLSLQNSRLALRNEMLPPPPAHDAAAGRSAGLRVWWRRLQRWPAGQLARDALQHWWQRQPWHPVADTVAQEAKHHLMPLVRRHPWTTAALGVAAGAAVVALKPWRARWAAPHLQAAPRHATRWLWRQVTSAPMQAAIASLLVMATHAGATASAEGDPAEAPPPSPTPAPSPPPSPDLSPDRVREPDEDRPTPPVRDPRLTPQS